MGCYEVLQGGRWGRERERRGEWRGVGGMRWARSVHLIVEQLEHPILLGSQRADTLHDIVAVFECWEAMVWAGRGRHTRVDQGSMRRAVHRTMSKGVEEAGVASAESGHRHNGTTTTTTTTIGIGI